MNSILAITFLVFAISTFLGLFDKIVKIIPGGKYFVGAIGLFVSLSIFISNGGWNTVSTTLGIGNPDATLSVPNAPELESPDIKIEIPSINLDGVDIPKIENSKSADNTLNLKPFDFSLISSEAKSQYAQALLKIGKSVEIKPPDNYDTWSSVGGREFQFGSSWKDVDKNGCDTRNDILKRDISAYRADSLLFNDAPKNCVVSSGELYDPYTGLVLDFKRGADTSSKVQIDHVVALHLAWQEGAKQWSQEKREQLANDPENLLAVDGPTNVRKSDGWCSKSGCDINANGIPGDPEDKLYEFWMPPAKNYRCDYAKKEIDVHEKYGLWLVPEEAATYSKTLGICSGQELLGGFFG